MRYRTMLTLALMFLLFRGISNAQNSNVSDYLGAYFSEAHPRAGFSVQATATGHTMSFCKDLILNDCKHVEIQKNLSGTAEFQIAADSPGGNALGFTAKAVLRGTVVVIEVKLADGKVWEFTRR